MPQIIQADIVSNTLITGCSYKLVLYAPEIAAGCIPGQFVNVQVSSPGQTDPFLKRPISICDASPEKGLLTLVYNVVGRGTDLLSKMTGCCEIVGPLGNGFRPADSEYIHVLVGGGVGSAPLYFLNNTLRAKGYNTRVFTGFGTESQIFTRDMFSEAVISTDDGSFGIKGFATIPLEQYIESERHKRLALYVCGPTPMMKAVCSIAGKYESVKQIQLSLENVMACGVGVCTGCVCRVMTEKGSVYRRVCKDGPVFDGKELVW